MQPPRSRLDRLQEEVIDTQLQIRDLEQKRQELKKRLNGKLAMLLNFKKLLKQVKPIDNFSSGHCPAQQPDEPKMRAVAKGG